MLNFKAKLICDFWVNIKCMTMVIWVHGSYWSNLDQSRLVVMHWVNPSEFKISFLSPS